MSNSPACSAKLEKKYGKLVTLTDEDRAMLGQLLDKKDIAKMTKMPAQFKDLILGSKEAMLYHGDDRLIKMSEFVYKDMIKTFKKAVTLKSASSIVNNYMVIPSMLKLNGIPLSKIPGVMKNAHKEYAEFLKTIDDTITSGGSLEHVKRQSSRDNIYMEMLDNGTLQTSLNDTIANLGSASLIENKMGELAGKVGGKKAKQAMDIYNLDPNTRIGSFFMNTFVMTDVVGRGALYTYQRRAMGLSSKDAAKVANDAFVDFSKPPPKAIEYLDAYMLPFAGWMYKAQMPLLKATAKRPVDAAMLAGSFYLLNQYTDFKTDSWNYYSAALDPEFFSMSPVLSGKLFTSPIYTIESAFVKDVVGVATGSKSSMELVGLNPNR